MAVSITSIGLVGGVDVDAKPSQVVKITARNKGITALPMIFTLAFSSFGLSAQLSLKQSLSA